MTNSNEVISIGKAIDNNFCYVFDKDRNIISDGSIGELYLGGEGLAIGYLHNDTLTSQVFINWINPQSKNIIKLYKTGDLVRQLEDGSFIFCGRVDEQLKINGHRIEPSEIESVLLNHPLVKQAAVKYLVNEKKLLAYVNLVWDIENYKNLYLEYSLFQNKVLDISGLNNGANLSDLNSKEYSALDQLSKDNLNAFLFQTIIKPNLLGYLKESLPSYMLPNNIEYIDKFSLNTNGKINKNCLSGNPILSEKPSTVKPQILRESIIIDVWEEILNLEYIHIHDNFFELGGHSFLAIKMLNTIEKILGCKLSLFEFYQEPTISKIVEQLDMDKNIILEDVLFKFNSVENRTPIFLFHPIDGELNWYNELISLSDQEYEIYGFNFIKGKEAGLSISESSKIYFEKIKNLKLPKSYILVGWSYGALLAYELARQLQLVEQQSFHLLLIDPPVIDKTILNEQIHDIEQLIVSQQVSSIKNISLSNNFSLANEFIFNTSEMDNNLLLSHLVRVRKNLIHMLNYEMIAKVKNVTIIFAANMKKNENHSWPEECLSYWEKYCHEHPVISSIDTDHYGLMQSPHVELIYNQIKIINEQINSTKFSVVYEDI
jgi:thioesterase domain-containing protein/acyl carrier protein